MFNRHIQAGEHRQHIRPPGSAAAPFGVQRVADFAGELPPVEETQPLDEMDMGLEEPVGGYDYSMASRTAARIDTLRSIVQNGQHEEIDGMIVDLQTANLLIQIYEKGNDNTKNLIDTAPLEKVVGAAWKLTSGRTAVSLDAFEQEGYDAWHRDEPAAPAANKMVMDALEGASVGDKSNIEIMKAFSRGFERGRQEMMDREFPEMRGASRTAGTEKVRGEAQVGDLVTYHDMANQRGEVWEVVEPPEGDSFTPSGIAFPGRGYKLRNVETGADHWSDLRQNGWTFATDFDLGRNASHRSASRRKAFLDTVELTPPRHRVAGWDWDDHLNGFIAAEAAREFTCACGDNVPAPGYTDCRCGKRWNAYAISANGSQKMIAREVPVRENVVMARTASRRTAETIDSENLQVGDVVKYGDETITIIGEQEYWEDPFGRDMMKYMARSSDGREGYVMFGYGASLPVVASTRTASRKTAAGWNKGTHPDISDLSDEQLQDFIDNVQESIDAGANVGEIMENKRDRFEEELRSRGRKATRKRAADYSNYSYDQLVDARDILRQEFADWKIDQTEYKDTLAEIEAEAENRGLTLASRKGRVVARRKIAAPSSGADAIAQHFPGWRVDDENGNFWEIQSPGGEHAFIHEEDGTYTVLTNDNTPDEFYETGLSFEDALAEVRAEGVI